MSLSQIMCRLGMHMHNYGHQCRFTFVDKMVSLENS